ncbi:hypothetical protein DFH07DRAFT_10761 [Mycena maculata]|uniref:Uncharacterized protein n=1 Tax=Mycena maculata TaxID=230809 RepID=A0AAD7NW95_9AGAR|nr:hypothetical protein DFH07DRAFT_10761 [Mycena maculata]
MSSSAIPHVIAFLTRPLLATFAPAAVASAQLILNASLSSAPTATFTLTSATTPPPAIHAASIGAGIPWTTWFNILGSGRDILLFYGPGYLKVRVGDAPVTDVWSEENQGSIIPISQMKSVPLLQQSTGARLRAMLLSARVRSMRRAEQEAKAVEPIRIPTLPRDSGSDDSSSDSESDSGSEYSSTSSKFTSYSINSLTSAGSPLSTPAKPACVPLPATTPAPGSRPHGVYSACKTTRRVPVDRSKKDLTSYLYQGGVTRVMTGGVMLGPRPAAHLVKFTRS